jgi:hypothetical protein
MTYNAKGGEIMREPLLTNQEIRILLGAEQPPRRKWSWRRFAINMLMTAAVIFFLHTLIYGPW